MILELVYSALVAVTSSVFSLIPEMELPFSTELTSFGSFIGSQIGGLDSFIPISEVAPVIAWALTVYLPFVFVFYTVRWVYSKVPVIGQ